MRESELDSHRLERSEQHARCVAGLTFKESVIHALYRNPGKQRVSRSCSGKKC